MENYIYRHETGIYYTKEARDLFLLNGGRGSFRGVLVDVAVHHIKSVFHIRTVGDIKKIENNPKVLKLVSDK